MRHLTSIAGVVLVLLSRQVMAQVAAQPNTLSGTVTELVSRLPVPDATVRLGTARGTTLATVRTDAQGRFRFPVSTSGKYRVTAQHIGLKVFETVINVSADVGEILPIVMEHFPVSIDSMLVLGIAEPAIASTQQLILGRLIDEDTGEPLSGGKVDLRDTHNKSVGTQVSDQNGRFRFVTPAPGTYSMKAERPGFLPGEQKNVVLSFGDTIAVQFRISRRAALLAPMMITASAKPWGARHESRGQQELYDRIRRYGPLKVAQYITRDTIDEYDERGLSMRQFMNRVVLQATPGSRNPTCFGSRLFVNGLPAPPTPPDETDDEDPWPLSLIDFIEVYTAPSVPGEFATFVGGAGQRSRMVKPCRVVSLWLHG